MDGNDLWRGGALLSGCIDTSRLRLYYSSVIVALSLRVLRSSFTYEIILLKVYEVFKVMRTP